MKVTKFLKAYL